MNGSFTRSALALQVIFHVRVTISVTTAAIARRCACQGRETALPSRHHPTMKKTETPTTDANDSPVKSQRFQVTRVG